MSLAAGPGRAGATSATLLPDELQLAVDQHVAYVQGLNEVCSEHRQYVID